MHPIKVQLNVKFTLKNLYVQCKVATLIYIAGYITGHVPVVRSQGKKNA